MLAKEGLLLLLADTTMANPANVRYFTASMLTQLSLESEGSKYRPNWIQDAIASINENAITNTQMSHKRHKYHCRTPAALPSHYLELTSSLVKLGKLSTRINTSIFSGFNSRFSNFSW
jgi:hypothetical protein